jgi:hypothetical protein
MRISLPSSNDRRVSRERLDFFRWEISFAHCSQQHGLPVVAGVADGEEGAAATSRSEEIGGGENARISFVALAVVDLVDNDGEWDVDAKDCAFKSAEGAVTDEWTTLAVVGDGIDDGTVVVAFKTFFEV